MSFLFKRSPSSHFSSLEFLLVSCFPLLIRLSSFLSSCLSFILFPSLHFLLIHISLFLDAPLLSVFHIIISSSSSAFLSSPSRSSAPSFNSYHAFLSLLCLFLASHPSLPPLCFNYSTAAVESIEGPEIGAVDAPDVSSRTSKFHPCSLSLSLSGYVLWVYFCFPFVCGSVPVPVCLISSPFLLLSFFWVCFCLICVSFSFLLSVCVFPDAVFLGLFLLFCCFPSVCWISC